MRRVVAVSTTTFFDRAEGLDREDAPVSSEPSSDPYTITKMAAFEDAMARADAGQDVVSTHPGAIFGPSPVAGNSLGKTSFNRVLLAALRGRLERYLRFPVSWVLADDVARGCLLALDNGVSGERYMLDGRFDDVCSIAEACNRACEMAGLDHRVEDVTPSDDPELVAIFGPTLVAIASKAAGEQRPLGTAGRVEDREAAGLRTGESRRRAAAHYRLAAGDRTTRLKGPLTCRTRSDRSRQGQEHNRVSICSGAFGGAHRPRGIHGHRVRRQLVSVRPEIRYSMAPDCST